jgi:hypothetical protein
MFGNDRDRGCGSVGTGELAMTNGVDRAAGVDATVFGDAGRGVNAAVGELLPGASAVCVS